MCKICNEKIYYDEKVSFSYLGHLNADGRYDEIQKTKINAIICPACGKLTPKAINEFGSIENALTHIIKLNTEK